MDKGNECDMLTHYQFWKLLQISDQIGLCPSIVLNKNLYSCLRQVFFTE